MIIIKGKKTGAFVLLLAFVMLALCACACPNVDANVNPSAPPTAEATDNVGGTNKPEDTPRNSGAASATPAPSLFPSATTGVSDEPVKTPGITHTPTPTATGTVAPKTQAPTATPIASTPAPTPTIAPDPVTGMIWLDDSAPVYCDMDFDGHPEKVEIELERQNSYTYNCVITITLGATGEELTSHYVTEYFSKALLNNFNSGDRRVELLVCCGSGNRELNIHCYRLNSSAAALDTYIIEGWLEAADDNTITVGRYMDILGTWACTSVFDMERDNFRFTQHNSEWIVYSDVERWCTVARELLVQIFATSGSDNVAGFLYEGDMLYPTSTDMETYIRFTTNNDVRGSITITKDSAGNVLISGRNPDHWFSDLEYIN